MNYHQYSQATGLAVIDDRRFEHFRSLVVDIIAEDLSVYIVCHGSNQGNEYLRSIGKGAHSIDTESFYDGCRSSLDNFRRSPIFSWLCEENDAGRFLFCIQCLFGLSVLKSAQKEKLSTRLQDASRESSFPIAVIRDGADYYVVPSSAPELETAVFDPTLAWLNDHPTVKAPLLRALRDKADPVKKRLVLDDLRLALELLLKGVLSNDKPLEKQGVDLGALLKSRGHSKEVANMYRVLLDYFCKYQNEHVKHDEEINDNEVDFLVLLGASFMKLFI